MPESSRRLRAALRYGEGADRTLGYSEIARRLGVTDARVSHWFNRGARVPEEMLAAIATMCEVPPSFLRDGWGAARWKDGDVSELGAAPDDLEDRLATLAERVTANEALIRVVGRYLSRPQLDEDARLELRQVLGLDT